MKPVKKAAEMTPAELGRYIDQSVLKPEFTDEDIRKYIQEGIDYNCATVCINPSSLPIARELCAGTNTGICVVCDFPFGKSTTESKVAQAEIICRDGDIEDLDIVANYGWIRSGRWYDVREDIKAVADVCHKYGSNLKVIFEVDSLTIEEVKRATEVAIEAGEGATYEVIEAMMEAADGRCKIKGAGGIRDREKFLRLIDMGIDRMGIGYKSTAKVLGLDK